MIRILRRSRLLALILLLATPALGGAWLQAAHPCPVDSPPIADHASGHGDHGTEGSAGSCHCVGSCASPVGAVLAAAAVLPPVAAPTPVARPRLAPGAPSPTLHPSDLLPPATAPPLA